MGVESCSNRQQTICAGDGVRAKKQKQKQKQKHTQKKDSRGEGRSEKETLARKPHDSAESPLHALTLEHTSVA